MTDSKQSPGLDVAEDQNVLPTKWERRGEVDVCPHCERVREGTIAFAILHLRECINPRRASASAVPWRLTETAWSPYDTAVATAVATEMGFDEEERDETDDANISVLARAIHQVRLEAVAGDERRRASRPPGRLVAVAKALRDFPSPGDPVEFARLHHDLYEAIDE